MRDDGATDCDVVGEALGGEPGQVESCVYADGGEGCAAVVAFAGGQLGGGEVAVLCVFQYSSVRMFEGLRSGSVR